MQSALCLGVALGLLGGLAAQQADDVAPTSSLVAVQTTGGASSRALGGLVAGPYDVETGPFDNRCLGVDHAWGHFWVSGGGHTTVGWSFMVHKYSTTGTYLASYPQTTFATTWGARDLESDEANNKLWGGAEGGELSTYNYDPTTGGLVHATLQTTAVPTTVRALARNPATGNFYTANFTSSVYEFNPAGTVVNSWASPGSALYGFAWDTTNSTLWGHGQDAAFASRHVFKLNLATMTNTGTEYAAPNTGIAGGLDMYVDSRNPGFLSHVTLGQGVPDNVVVSDSAEAAGCTPSLAVTGVTAGGTATATIDCATPGGAVVLGYSLIGGGPTNISTPTCGVVTAALSLPVAQVNLTANSAGTATYTANLLFTISIDVWIQAFDVASCSLTNSILETT